MDHESQPQPDEATPEPVEAVIVADTDENHEAAVEVVRDMTAPVALSPVATPPTADKPVSLQAVEAPRPHVFRFGIRAMFVLMATCGVQFALVFYLGALLGLLVGAVVCMVVLGALVVAAMVLQPASRSRTLDSMDQLAIRMTLAVVILFMAMIVAGGGTFAWQEAGKLRRNSALRDDLGFTAQQDFQSRGDEMLVVETIAPGKPFDQAGIREGDFVLIDPDLRNVDGFYAMLQENRGSDVTLTVSTGGSTVVSTSGQERQLTISVPPP